MYNRNLSFPRDSNPYLTQSTAYVIPIKPESLKTAPTHSICPYVLVTYLSRLLIGSSLLNGRGVRLALLVAVHFLGLQTLTAMLQHRRWHLFGESVILVNPKCLFTIVLFSEIQWPHVFSFVPIKEKSILLHHWVLIEFVLTHYFAL